MKKKIWIADLTHTTQGISAATFPLGVSYVFAYANHKFKKEYVDVLIYSKFNKS